MWDNSKLRDEYLLLIVRCTFWYGPQSLSRFIWRTIQFRVVEILSCWYIVCAHYSGFNWSRYSQTASQQHLLVYLASVDEILFDRDRVFCIAAWSKEWGSRARWRKQWRQLRLLRSQACHMYVQLRTNFTQTNYTWNRIPDSFSLPWHTSASLY